jgi:hypothetical protein
MLYQMAQLYDEWAGEDYEGSSCRGAMKGWHRHGVCAEKLWPYNKGTFVSPHASWEQDAASRPLGAYYRIDKSSINDMQSAIYEVGAIYCSANVHEGWHLDKTSEPVIIPFHEKRVGNHAFAVIGYTEDGFIVQNSWGQDWGYHGFALVSYGDWVQHGTDAWVAVMGAPMTRASSPTAYSSISLREAATSNGGRAGRGKSPGAEYTYANPKVQPWSEGEAYRHTLVLGNNGIPIHRLVSEEDAFTAAEQVCFNYPASWLSAQPSGQPRKLAIYAHGGLNSEAGSIERIRMMAPYFRENGIYPLFITWKTGPLETIGDMLSDSIRKIFNAAPEMRDEGVIKKIKEAAAEMRDRAIEAACEDLLVKPMWSEMKQNAMAGAEKGAGLDLLAQHLYALKSKIPGLEIHLVGHSAGSLILGYLLSKMDASLTASTLTLFAPACTIGFANEHYGKAIQSSKLKPADMHVDIMDDEREKADTIGPYGKSLLYLVSRALEARHKTPLLGMEKAWSLAEAPDQWWKDKAKTNENAIKEWLRHAVGVVPRPYGKKDHEYVRVSKKGDRIKLSHGSFDNDIEVVGAMLERIRGGELVAEVENLAY